MKSSIRIISDDVVFFNIFTPILKHSIPDIEIIIYRTHEDIYKKFNADNCAAILIDDSLPGISTLEVIQYLRQTKLLDIPILYFPDLVSESYLYKAHNIGATNLITKPYDPFIIARKIINILQK